jgi:hypothetical protein
MAKKISTEPIANRRAECIKAILDQFDKLTMPKEQRGPFKDAIISEACTRHKCKEETIRKIMFE